MDLNELSGEKAWRQLHKNAMSNIEQIQEAIPHKPAAIQPSWKLSKLDEPYKWGTAGEVRTNS